MGWFKEKKPIISSHWALLEVAALVVTFIYVLCRCFLLPLTGDEWGFLHTIHSRGYFDDIFGFRQDLFSQGEVLALLLSKLCDQFLRLDEVQAIRVPVLASYVLYVFFAWRCRRLFGSPLFRALAFLALILNAFVLDYCAFAQGIALSLALTLGCLCFLTEIAVRSECPNSSCWRAHCVAWQAALAPLAHMAFMPACLGCYGVIILLWFRAQGTNRLRGGRRWIRQFVVDNHYLVAPLLVIVLCFVPRAMVFATESNRIVTDNAMATVTDTVVSGMVSSLVVCMFYDIRLPVFTAGLIAWIAVILSAILGFVSFRKRWWSPASIMFLWLVITIMAIVSAHLIIGMPYPKIRWALYLVPAFVLQFAWGADQMASRCTRLLVGGVLIGSITIGCLNMNLTHTLFDRSQADVSAVVQTLATIHKKDGRPVVLYLSDGRKWLIWYYAVRTLGDIDGKRFEDPGCGKAYNWFAMYEGYCGRPRTEPRHFLPTTNYLLISPEDEPLVWVPNTDTTAGDMVPRTATKKTLTLIAEYPTSSLRLYAYQ